MSFVIPDQERVEGCGSGAGTHQSRIPELDSHVTLTHAPERSPGLYELSRRFATTPSSPLERTAAISSAPEASNVSEKRILSGKLGISSRNILRRVASGLLRKSAPASTGRIKNVEENRRRAVPKILKRAKRR